MQNRVFNGVRIMPCEVFILFDKFVFVLVKADKLDFLTVAQLVYQKSADYFGAYFKPAAYL